MTAVGLFILGLCFGSFANALVWRIHEQAKPPKKRVATTQDLSIVTGRSMCPFCQHTLIWYDLLPVISWLSLGGKCRYCRHTISLQYPLVELLTAILFVYSYYYWPYSFTGHGTILFILWLIFLVGFIALAIYDLRWMLLPDRMIFPLQALAVIYIGIKAIGVINSWQAIEGALLGVLCIAGLFYGIFQISKGKWIGGGDVKLAVIIGLLVGGPLGSLLVIFLASVFGSVFSIPLVIMGKSKIRIPFGPFLILATILVYLFGTSLIAWYKRQVLLI